MCITIPSQIVEIVDPIHRLAFVALAGQKRLVNLSPLAPSSGVVGDWVIVQAGLAVGRLSEEEAQSTLVLLHELEQLYDEAS
jgi:hydrogenase assembly chaperone HypC/HupF